jgi:glucose 1-dehydrogenase
MKRPHNPKCGCIINISSVHQVIPKPHYVPYATSRCGLEMMTKTMTLELAIDKIRATIVCPRVVETDMN